MEALGGFSGRLLLLTDWIWDDEYDADPTAGYREAINESRSLGEVPGFLFAPDNLQEASELMALVIERSWTARFYLATGVTRSEEHTSELQSLMRNSYAVFCLTTKR